MAIDGLEITWFSSLFVVRRGWPLPCRSWKPRLPEKGRVLESLWPIHTEEQPIARADRPSRYFHVQAYAEVKGLGEGVYSVSVSDDSLQALFTSLLLFLLLSLALKTSRHTTTATYASEKHTYELYVALLDLLTPLSLEYCNPALCPKPTPPLSSGQPTDCQRHAFLSNWTDCSSYYCCCLQNDLIMGHGSIRGACTYDFGLRLPYIGWKLTPKWQASKQAEWPVDNFYGEQWPLPCTASSGRAFYLRCLFAWDLRCTLIHSSVLSTETYSQFASKISYQF